MPASGEISQSVVAGEWDYALETDLKEKSGETIPV
jgi:hypothetical protein